MEKLKRDSQKLYIWITLGLVVLLSVLNSLFDEVMKLSWSSGWIIFFMVVYFLGHIVLFSLAAWLFWRQINLRINLEQERIRQETNLIFANIAHDLKTPLTSVVGYSRILEDGINISQEQSIEINHLIYQKAIRANEILDEMFEYAKLNADDLSLNLELIDMNELTRQVVADLFDQFERAAMPLNLEFSDLPINQKVDVNKMKRAIANLLTNAYTHNEQGTLVSVRVDAEGIAIADSGETITSEEFNDYTQPFISGEEARHSNSSSGLGLAITQAIVHQHGFQLDLRSEKLPYTKAFVIKFDK